MTALWFTLAAVAFVAVFVVAWLAPIDVAWPAVIVLVLAACAFAFAGTWTLTRNSRESCHRAGGVIVGTGRYVLVGRVPVEVTECRLPR